VKLLLDYRLRSPRRLLSLAVWRCHRWRCVEIDDGRIELREWVNLHSLVADLPAAQREAVVRRVLADEPYAAIAASIGALAARRKGRFGQELASPVPGCEWLTSLRPWG